MTKTGKIIRVVGAAIIQDGQVLCLQRGQEMSLAGLWEFPGGKLEAGETETQALAREIKEELTLEIEVGDWVTTAEYAYEFATIQLAVYKAKILSGSLTLLEHQASRWVQPQDLMSLEWRPSIFQRLSSWPKKAPPYRDRQNKGDQDPVLVAFILMSAEINKVIMLMHVAVDEINQGLQLIG